MCRCKNDVATGENDVMLRIYNDKVVNDIAFGK